ncbi:MAG: right-handed parallel beta-helix repeat-containing protein [Bacteroidetes bacterium]|nr:right-handed parallel beta-helix repeat-containing protein [Bacteroidota bacterium]
MRYRYCLFFFCFLIIYFTNASAQQDIFYGPFKSWTNLKAVYGAYGDGVHDDTHALQLALNDLGQNNHSPVLYIPAGTYKITQTLTMQSRKGIAIIGESPEKTIIKWAGVAGAKMFFLNGVSYSEYSRLTWDGSKKAGAAIAHEWDGKVQFANSGTQHSDEIFKDVAIGLKSGPKMDAEFAIRRCRFYNCTATGISLGGFNALDWWVWDCYFENCVNGVANNSPGNGAGNFHVYRSIFKNSSHADISLGNSEFFSFRDNVSYNSNCFIAASQFSNTSPITIQRNTIITNKDKTMALLFTKGNVLFLDNTFITPDSGKNYVIDNTDNFKTPPADLTLEGNNFTAKQKLFVNTSGRTIDIDTKTGIPPIKSLPSLNPIPFAVPVNDQIIEVNSRMGTDTIQLLINKAIASKKISIIHFNYGSYSVSKTIHIPGNAAITLVGDGLSSVLNTANDSVKAIFEIGSPAKVILQDLYLNGKGKSDGIVIHDNDQVGNIMYADQLLLYHGVATNLFINGFSKTDFWLECFQHNYCSKDGISIKVIGTNDKFPAALKILGGESSNMGNSYSVEKNARIILFDTWYENGSGSKFLELRDKGEFVLNGGKIANTNANKDTEPFIDIDNFYGKVTLAQIILNEPKKTIQFKNPYNGASMLALGILSWNDSTNNMYNFSSNVNGYATRNNRYNLGGGSFPLADKGNTNEFFIKNMLGSIRETHVSDKLIIKNKNTSWLFLKRVMIENGVNNVLVEH